MPWYPKAILSVIIALLLALASVRSFRAWALRVDIRWLIAFHLIRFVGFYFLYLYAQHELPYNFAVFGGSGDIIVAMFVLPIILFVSFKPAVVADYASSLRVLPDAVSFG
jgi:hypothetical protein